MVLPDGIGVILGARILGTPLCGGRVPGIDFASALLNNMAKSGGSVYLLGAKPGIAEEAGRKLAEKYPGLKISGASDGYFTDDEPVIEKINLSKPDVLLVCLGSPKQEYFMAGNLDCLEVKLCAGLGGSLDVFAGRAKRAPAVFQKLGLEWLYRLFREPRRIKRMLKLPLFIITLIGKRIWAG
jgi:N-acetylglucosaminyldiphosphoundecaprenol N-acetyl-beta-D-mannosaminyltransferase